MAAIDHVERLAPNTKLDGLLDDALALALTQVKQASGFWRLPPLGRLVPLVELGGAAGYGWRRGSGLLLGIIGVPSVLVVVLGGHASGISRP